MNFGSLRIHLSFSHKHSRNFSTGRFTGMSYPLEVTANQQEVLGRSGWPLFSDAEDSNCCDRESLQSSREAELAPEPQSTGQKMKKKMLDGRTVEAPLRQAVDVGKLHCRKTSPLLRFFRKFDPPLKNGHNVECPRGLVGTTHAH